MHDRSEDEIARALWEQEATSAWQISAFRRQIGTFFAMHLFAASFFLWLTIDPSSWQRSAGWAICMLLCAGIAAAWSRKATDPRRREGRSPRAVLASTFILSLPWILAVGLLLPDSPPARLAVASVLVLLAGGVTQSMGAWFSTAAISLSCILLPSALVLIVGGSELERSLGYCLLGFFCLYLVLCFRSTRLLQENSRLRLVSERMVAQLQDQVHRQSYACERVEEALTVAQQACLDKSRFLAAASHDLRQPMHAICLFLAALKSEAFETRSRYLLDRLDRSLAGLDDLFNRLLDISHLDAGLIVPTIKTVDATRIAQTLESRFVPVAAAKSLDFRVRCTHGLQLRTDPELLIELLTNLLSNAFRYTERGGILLAFRARRDSVLIQVWDTGCGIADDKIGIVFDEFVQLNNPARDRRKGLGLGLAIVKRLAEAMHHRLQVSSRPGQGSCFGLKVERVPGIAPMGYDITPAASPRTLLRGALVLVVDDEIDILSAMEAILDSWGCLSILARSIEEAEKYVESSLRFPDVVITDHRLENHRTSIDVNKAIAPLLPFEIPMIVISGESSPSLQNDILARGWFFMNKPVNAGRLHMTLSAALERTSAALNQVA
ncbi:ATP-binding response regulator [Noviherbaspirillum sp.]|uniref:ATP-binding response regulator n=1 Tax=Noviherbaspirillum sp. TaxID=1926288 RepID=UPI002D550E8D|nr:ATP-binding protein [Noviherbaspirillum sp.]HZW19931.1 ATP-binding protein [Noviherbaspirillum sp.]